MYKTAEHMNMSVALCIVGQMRTLSDPWIQRSQQQHLLAPLRAQGSLKVFAVVDPKDDLELVARVYSIAPSKVRTHEVHWRWGQYERYTIVWRMVREAEVANSNRPFMWIIKGRPDFYFYGPIPRLVELDREAVHCRMRCTLFSKTNGHFDMNMIPAENHQLMWVACGHGARRDCRCMQRQCGPSSFVMDDQMAIVPRKHAELFFSFEKEWDSELTKRVGNCPQNWPWQACYQTALLVERSIPILPASMCFSIARYNKSYGANTRLDTLFLDANLLNGQQSASVAGVVLHCV